ncbi:MAG: CBS domain-containing protein [Planctomycetes bacterium]|nr:CBS domain-containing protein [Planctomycetota bacterium]
MPWQQTVESLMTRDVLTTPESEPLVTAMETMAEQRIRHVLVTDANNALAGILSNRDVARAVLVDRERKLDLYAVTVGSVMTRDPITVGAQAPLAEAARLMLENRINALPVLDKEGELAGIITSDDLLYAVVQAGPLRSPQL